MSSAATHGAACFSTVEAARSTRNPEMELQPGGAEFIRLVVGELEG